MKQLPVVLVLGFALTLCNLSNKLRTATNSKGSGKSTSSSNSSGDAETATPTAAQIEALAGGQTVKWDQQGMSWTVPPQWKQVSNESKELVWSSPGGSDAANLIVSISPMDESFPTDVSIKAFYDGAKTRQKNGEVDELKWLEIDGLKGVQFREANPEKPDGFRRLQWMAYRKYAGQVQFVNLMLSSNGRGFPKHQDAMYGVLYSTKIVH
ncbi:MAG TPA: hypothetical protein DHU55_08695 [Blastocatellia bacterium]|jgi:hypothetical protein|nr:hypothetical protein [Blastocatellia bacterium]HAF23779.1 hypothetical protein [Blastocatellia bacterium]HCX29829.1 hypothetical protein [Blastocatellia bacterium]